MLYTSNLSTGERMHYYRLLLKVIDLVDNAPIKGDLSRFTANRIIEFLEEILKEV